MRVGIFFGGRSSEHEVSLLSAAAILRDINKLRYKVVLAGITKEGFWRFNDDARKMLGNLVPDDLAQTFEQVDLDPDHELRLPPANFFKQVDVVFSVLHGPYGEDGVMQGVLELANKPFVGAGVLSSAISMNKVIFKKLLETEALPQVPYIYVKHYEQANLEEHLVQIKALGYPVFIKPASLGSSIGISKVHRAEEVVGAFKLAFKHDKTVLVEKAVCNGRELEVAVLGNDDPLVSVVGEIIPSNDFYDYHAKYIDNASIIKIPAEVPQKISEEIKGLALKVYKLVECKGLARVDFFLDHDGRVLVNELNTLPGFTSISMYNKLFAHLGIMQTELITRLIESAVSAPAFSC
ncbi:MAG: hypothetical protein RLZ12_367 [Bacillota bacterium]